MSKRHPLDRSTMFTALLELSAEYGGLESRAGERVVTQALAAWYESPSKDMFAFAKTWVREHPYLSLKKHYA